MPIELSGAAGVHSVNRYATRALNSIHPNRDGARHTEYIHGTPSRPAARDPDAGLRGEGTRVINDLSVVRIFAPSETCIAYPLGRGSAIRKKEIVEISSGAPYLCQTVHGSITCVLCAATPTDRAAVTPGCV